MSGLIRYNYVHEQTESTTGYFACQPVPPPTPGQLLTLLSERPFDSFLRRHALGVFANMTPNALAAVMTNEKYPHAPASFWSELALAAPHLDSVTKTLQTDICGRSGPDASPLLYLRRAALPDAWLHTAWAEIFTLNMQRHNKVPSPAEVARRGLPPLFAPEVLERFAQDPPMRLGELFKLADGFERTESDELPEPDDLDAPLLPAAEVAELALERLQNAGAVAGPEQRHTASLSPIALLMPWRLGITVNDGRNSYTLKGQANTYGRGMSLPQARASCRMEMVERFSAYLSIGHDEVKNRARPMKLKRGRRSELLEHGEDALDPNGFYTEAPYNDEPLVWAPGLEARRAAPWARAEHRPVWVPLQLAALFSNCDEIDLVSAPGSTGIATGSTVAQARLAALVEVLERDSEATMLYSKQRCFRLEPEATQDEALAALLLDYRALGINVQFMDLTGPLGLPCYQAFVIGPKGNIHRGHGAALSPRRAIVSALTETPYPYPGGGASGPLLKNLPARTPEGFTDYSSGSAQKDLAMLEALLSANGLHPVYVDLTHEVLRFPVIRVLVPGLQPGADFDDFTRVSPRLYKDYLRLHEQALARP